jgi:hypothetical protein
MGLLFKRLFDKTIISIPGKNARGKLPAIPREHTEWESFMRCWG